MVMGSRFTKEWVLAALSRAVKTFAQSMLAMITLGAALSDVDWVHILSVSAVTTLYSILTSFATDLPESQFQLGLLEKKVDNVQDKEVPTKSENGT